ncbi:hypothetical protein HDU96_001616 [Phlyctochytrium bullatum]|nr:hypothetical protein HDU96_001616 [Phlyctochytrium bullatum]
MLSKLYMFKLDELLSSPISTDGIIGQILPKPLTAKPIPLTLRRCVYCHAVYPKHLERYLLCPNGQPLLDFYGDLFMMHERVWALVTFMYCTRCESLTSLSEYNQCFEHESEIIFPPGECQKGRYPCCDSTEYRFNPFFISKGCKRVSHVLDETSETFRMFQANSDLILDQSDASETKLNRNAKGDGVIKMFGRWSEGIYKRMESSNLAINMMSGPIGIGPAQISSKRTHAKKIPPHIQRCEDAARMAAITKQLIALREQKP